MPARALKFLSALALLLAGRAAFGDSPTPGDKPIWANEGVPITLQCMPAGTGTAQATHGDASATVECLPGGAGGQALRIRYKNMSGADLDLRVPLAELNGGRWRPQEILWAPDGLAFLINGSENEYAGSDFLMFRVQENALVRSSITRVARNDMVDRLARCWPYIREIVGAQPQFNMSAISWSDDTLAVFAEVPCTSTYENSMCSVYGYEMNARSGAIQRVLSADEVRSNWRAHMSWSMTEPDLPTCDPHTGKVKER